MCRYLTNLSISGDWFMMWCVPYHESWFLLHGPCVSQRFGWVAQPISIYGDIYWAVESETKDGTVVFESKLLRYNVYISPPVFWPQAGGFYPSRLFELNKFGDKMFDWSLRSFLNRRLNRDNPTTDKMLQTYCLGLVVWIRCDDHPSRWESTKKGR